MLATLRSYPFPRIILRNMMGPVQMTPTTNLIHQAVEWGLACLNQSNHVVAGSDFAPWFNSKLDLFKKHFFLLIQTNRCTFKIKESERRKKLKATQGEDKYESPTFV